MEPTIRVFNMNVGNDYPTPYCGWATWIEHNLRTRTTILRGMNCEGRAYNDAMTGIQNRLTNRLINLQEKTNDKQT